MFSYSFSQLCPILINILISPRVKMWNYFKKKRQKYISCLWNKFLFSFQCIRNYKFTDICYALSDRLFLPITQLKSIPNRMAWTVLSFLQNSSLNTTPGRQFTTSSLHEVWCFQVMHLAWLKQVREQVLLEHVSGHKKEQKATRYSQQGFTTGQPCLTFTIITFYNTMTRFVNKGRIADSFFFFCL